MESKKIKILHLTTDSKIGGTENLLIWLARNYDHQNFQMRFCTLKKKGPLQEQLESIGEKTYGLKIEKNIWDWGKGKKGCGSLMRGYPS